MSDYQDPDMRELGFRVKSLETTVKEQGEQGNRLSERMIRLDEGVRGITEQNRLQHDATSKAMSDLKDYVTQSHTKTQELISSMGKELSMPLDKLLVAVDFGEDPNGTNFRKNMAWTSEARKREEERGTIWRKNLYTYISLSIIGAFALGVIMLLKNYLK